jgi:hypothetical protein
MIAGQRPEFMSGVGETRYGSDLLDKKVGVTRRDLLPGVYNVLEAGEVSPLQDVPELPHGIASEFFDVSEEDFMPPNLLTSMTKYDSYAGTPLFHKTLGTAYREDRTRMRNLDESSHFEPDAIGWSRTSTHKAPEGGTVRLIEELQSDLHSRAISTRRAGWSRTGPSAAA